MIRITVLLFVFAVTSGLGAEPVWSWETAWTARQLWKADAGASGVVGWTSVSGWTDPGLWFGLGVGLDAAVSRGGTFESLAPQGLLRTGVQFPVAGWAVFVPWAGGTLGWVWNPGAGKFLWSAEAGLDAEVRLWDNQFGLIGAGFRSDGAFEVAVGFRDRSTWRLPPPPPKPRLIAGRVPAPRGQRPRATSSFPAPAPIPALKVEVVPGAFSPDGDGAGDVLWLKLSSDNPRRILRWTWTVIAPQQQLFFRQNGQGPLPGQLGWNGVSDTGELVYSATEYTLVFEVEDDQGRKFGIRKVITTDVLLLKDGDRYLIRLPSINFTANSPGLAPPSAGPGTRLQLTLLDQNAQVLKRLAEILLRFPQYTITIVGHANLVNWADPVKAKEEDLQASRPLSLQRAQAVKTALVSLKLDARRIKVEGAGGSRPLFPFGDGENSWKNRRVDIVLDRIPTVR